MRPASTNRFAAEYQPTATSPERCSSSRTLRRACSAKITAARAKGHARRRNEGRERAPPNAPFVEADLRVGPPKITARQFARILTCGSDELKEGGSKTKTEARIFRQNNHVARSCTTLITTSAAITPSKPIPAHIASAASPICRIN